MSDVRLASGLFLSLGPLKAILLVIDMAHTYTLETRIRCQIETHRLAGVEPQTLVMNFGTMNQLLSELDGHKYAMNYFWIPAQGDVMRFHGLPILVKDYVADMEVLIGV